MSTYYERNKGKIKENRRKRYQEQNKQKQNNVILSVAKDLPTYNHASANEGDSSGFALRMTEQIFLGTIILFSVFLIWQGAIFFMKQGYSMEEAYICSVFGELLLIVSSVLIFHAETKRTKQVFTVICSLSIVLLGAFLHNGIKKSLIEPNPEYQRVRSEYNLTQSSIEDLKRDKENQAENYKTKRNEIQNKIETKLSTLAKQSSKLSAFEAKSMGIGEYYVAWIRIALMILNAYLVHAFLRELSLNIGDI